MMSESPECFGTILPDILAATANTPAQGKVFVCTEKILGTGARTREIKADLDAWDACRRCPAFVSCHDFCKMKLMLTNAMKQ